MFFSIIIKCSLKYKARHSKLVHADWLLHYYSMMLSNPPILTYQDSRANTTRRAANLPSRLSQFNGFRINTAFV